MSGELGGKVAAITGAGAGIGRAVALAFADAGAAVVCNDVDGTAAEATVLAIAQESGRAIGVTGDAATAACADACVSGAVSAFGGLDVMVANAAISIYSRLDEMTLEVFDAIVDTNLKGPLLSARAAVPALRVRGGGSIVLVSSVQAFQGLAGCVPYAAAKDGIRVNAIAPGTIDTPMLRRDLEPMNVDEREGFIARVAGANALGRIGGADEVAAAAVFLASDRASYVTGSCLLVDGGFLAVKTI